MIILTLQKFSIAGGQVVLLFSFAISLQCICDYGSLQLSCLSDFWPFIIPLRSCCTIHEGGKKDLVMFNVSKTKHFIPTKKNLDFCLSWLFSQGGSVSWMPLGTKVPSQTSNVTHIYNSLIKLLVKMVRFLVPLQKLPNFSYYMVCLYKSQIRQKMAYWYHILAGTVHSTLSSIEFKSLHAALWVMK